MAFASPQPASAKKKNNTPNKELIIKINTSKGFVTLGRVGLYDESSLHTAVAKLGPEQLCKLLSNSQLEIVNYSRDTEDNIQLII